MITVNKKIPVENIKERIISAFSEEKSYSINSIANVGDWNEREINEDFFAYIKGDVPYEILEKHSKSLAAFSEAAFCRFIKDFMLYALDYPESELCEYLIYRLVHVTQEDAWREISKLLNKEQYGQIRDFLLVISEILEEQEQFLVEESKLAFSIWNELVELK